MNLENLTPERLREILDQTAKLRTNYTQQIALLAELEHTLVAKLVQPAFMTTGPHRVRGDLPTPRGFAPRCERCRQSLGHSGGEHVLHFEGRYWHAGNCLKEPQAR